MVYFDVCVETLAKQFQCDKFQTFLKCWILRSKKWRDQNSWLHLKFLLIYFKLEVFVKYEDAFF